MKIFRCVILIILCFTFCLVVLADTEELQISYTTESKDKKFTFVMLGDANIIHLLTEKEKENEFSIRQKYNSSGLYLSDDNTCQPICQPLFTVNWYSYEIFLSSDNAHLIKMGNWAKKKSDEAFSFYKKDRLLKLYKVEDLVDFDWLLPHSISHFRWAKEVYIDNANNTFIVKTLLYDEFVFDINTGQMISSMRYSRILFAVISIFSFAMLVLIINSIKKKRKINF